MFLSSSFLVYQTSVELSALLVFQAIDDDCNQTGQMTAALLDWPQVRNVENRGKVEEIFS